MPPSLCSYPIDSVMGEWVQGWGDWKPTGRTGTLEVFRTDTEWPATERPKPTGRNRHYPHYWEGRQTDQAGPTVVKGGAGRIAAQVCLAAGGSASETEVEHGIPIPRKPGLHAHRNLAFDAIDWSALGIGALRPASRRNSSGGLRKRATAAGIEIEIRAIEFHDSNHRKAKAFRVWRTK